MGLGVAVFCLRGVPHITAIDLPRANEIGADWIVFGFATALSVITGILFGLAPSLSLPRPDVTTSLRLRAEAAKSGTSGAVRGALVVSQVALSTILLIGPALLIQSVMHLENANPGFDSGGLLTFRLSLPTARYDTDQKRGTRFSRTLRPEWNLCREFAARQPR